jgi:PAS domain S-box-containing protein
MLGWSEQELLGATPPFRYWPAERVEEITESLSNAIRTPNGAISELQFCRRNGELLDVLVLSSELHDATGKQIGILGVVYDITDRKRAERARAEIEQKYRALVEDMPEMMCRFLPDGTLPFVNTAYCDYFETSKEALVGQNFFQFIPEEARDAVRDRYLSLTHDNPSVTYEHQVLGPQGQMRWQEWTDRALFDDHGKVIEFQSLGRDVTERREMIRRIRESEERFRLALHNSPVIVFNQDADLRYTWIHNPNLTLGTETVIGKTDAELLSREDADRLMEIKGRVLREGVPAREEVAITFGGETHHYDLKVEPLRDSSGTIMGITCVAADISGYKQEEQALRESQLRMSRLSFELMTAHEEERKHVSKELHDELAQALTLIKFRIRRAKDLMHDDKKTSAEECDLSLEYLDHVIRGVRHLSEELSPPILDDLGLTAGLSRLVEEHRSRSGFSVTSSIMNIDPFLPKPSQIVFYRILDECLENISAHAHARNVSVLVSSLADRIFMHVTDDGIGFDLPQVRMMSSEGSGIAVMEERAKMLGGMLSISSEKDKGTQVALSIPAPAVVQHR